MFERPKISLKSQQNLTRMEASQKNQSLSLASLPEHSSLNLQLKYVFLRKEVLYQNHLGLCQAVRSKPVFRIQDGDFLWGGAVGMLVLMAVWLKNPRWDNCSSKFFGKKLSSCRFPKYYRRTPSIINTLTWGIQAFETLSWERPQASLSTKGVHYGHGRVLTWKLGPVLCGRSQACSHLRPTCWASVRSSLFPVTRMPRYLTPSGLLQVSPSQRRLTWPPMENNTAYAITPLYFCHSTCSPLPNLLECLCPPH